MGLSVTVLGCSGSYAAPGNACSGYLVEADGTSVWLDTGPGTLANLQEHVSLDELDGVVVSHEHPDHWLELPVLRNALKYGSGREGVPVIATAGVRRLCEAVVSDGSEPTFAWQEVSDGSTAEVGDIRFTFSRTDHPVETMAVRADADGSSLAYTADTGPGWGLERLGPGLDLALCEATLLNEQEGQAPHLSNRQAGETARRAGVGRLVLTHLWPENDPDEHRREGEAAFGAPVTLAEVHGRYDA